MEIVVILELEKVKMLYTTQQSQSLFKRAACRKGCSF
jgi:hypothetical protein